MNTCIYRIAFLIEEKNGLISNEHWENISVNLGEPKNIQRDNRGTNLQNWFNIISPEHNKAKGCKGKASRDLNKKTGGMINVKQEVP